MRDRLRANACLALILWVLSVACRRPPGREAIDVQRPEPTASSEALARPASPEVLEPGSSHDRSLRGGETDTFAVLLDVEQLLDLRVDQHGIDVTVTLLGPLGERLLEVDNPSGADGARGVERVVWIAATPGSYTIKIQARAGQSALSPGGSGRYTIELEEPRLAEPSDRSRVAAERAKADADLLYAKRTAGSRQQAIGRYQDALAAFRALHDVSRQADVRYRLGRTWRALGEKERAFEAFESALRLYQTTPNKAQQAQCRHYLCRHYKSRNELESALSECRAAFELWQAVGDRLGTSATAHELGYVYRLLNEGHRALTLYDRALELRRALGRPSGAAQTLHNRGRLYAALGQRLQAREDLEEALEIRRRLGEERNIAISLNSLGFLHARWQEMETAREYFAQALELRQAMGEFRAGKSLLGLGWTELEVDPARSATYFKQALEVFRQEGSRTWQAVALLYSGRQASARDHLARVPEQLTRALHIFEAVQDLASIAETRLAIAGAMRRLGRYSEAQGEIENALEIIEDLRTRGAASLGQRATFFATKQAYHEFYIDLLMARGFDADALVASEQARARSLIDALSERDQGPRRSVAPALLEKERRLQRQLADRQVRIESLLAGATAGHEDLVSRLKDEQRDLLRRYDKLQGDIRLESPRDGDSRTPPLSSVEDIQRWIGPETLLLEYRLGEQRSFLWAVTSDTLAAFELPARDRIEKAARFAAGFISREHEGRMTRSSSRARLVLADLSRWLLADAGSRLRTARRLLIVADGALQYLPFEALAIPGDSAPEPAEPLISMLDEIVYLPSASTLAVLRNRLADRQPAPRLLAVLADPVFTTDDPRYHRPADALPVPERPTESTRPAGAGRRSGGAVKLERLIHTAREAETILALIASEEPLEARGFDASREVLTGGELARHRIVHLATHGELNAEHAELSRLVLSRFDSRGQPRDGSLYAYEVYGLELPAELVVLSACQTALGEEIRGEGLVGLPHGFMHAGAARVVVSLWRVEDEATAVLMGHFYENMLGERKMAPAVALRAAKNSIRLEEDWQDPYYWAGFVFQGEWKDFPK